MPSYRVRCDDGHTWTVEASYRQFDEAGGAFPCPAVLRNPKRHCDKVARVVFDPDAIPVTHFNGPGFTRRTTDPAGNRGIDHTDWRMGENWPGPPEKKVKRPKITNWTGDDFRKGAI